MVSERCIAALEYKIFYTHPWVCCGAPGASTHSLGTMIQGECVKSSQATDFSNTRMRIALSGANTYTKILAFPERFVLSFLEEPWNLYVWIICTLVVCILCSYTVEEAIKGTRFPIFSLTFTLLLLLRPLPSTHTGFWRADGLQPPS